MENSGSLKRPCHSIESILDIGPSLVEGNTTKMLQPLKTSCHHVEPLSSRQERKKKLLVSSIPTFCIVLFVSCLYYISKFSYYHNNIGSIKL